MGNRRPARRVLASAIVLLIPISGCSGSDAASPGKVADTTTTTVGPAVKPVHEDAAQKRAARLVLTEDDVPVGWSPMQEAAVDDVDAQVRTCLGTDPGIGEIGRSSSGFSHVDQTGRTQTISSMVRVYKTVADAVSIERAWKATRLPVCLDLVFERALGNNLEGSAKQSKLEGLAGVPAVVADYSGASGSLHLVLAVVREGSDIALVRAVGLNAPIDDTVVVDAAAAVRKRLRAR
ncbi:MAG: hypothetical protein KDB02_08895 [Acidimicrobiales bacterium]|nr:hypothetical protein [Acidimicrobiales bacterium]MCB1247334.1 hypothetical protein [Acidimicrobiia bacterium]